MPLYNKTATGTVTSVTAGDTSVVVGGTGAAPTVVTGTLDVIAADHPAAADWSNNSHKITSLANGSGAQDAAAFGQIPVLDGTTGDIAASPGTAAAGAAGKAADAAHVHPQPAMLAPTGLTGATSASRYAGGTTSGSPASGTFATGDFTVDETGKIWICTSAGTPGTWVTAGGLIASQTLGSPAASITFSSIPQTYTQLRLVAVGASSTAAEATRWYVRVNGDAGTNYDAQLIQGVNGSVTANPENTTNQWLAFQNDLPGASATSGVPGIFEVTIPNYTGTTFHKIGLWRSGYSDAATAFTDASVNLAAIGWRSTAAITSLSITPVAGNLVTGTTAYLYAS